MGKMIELTASDGHKLAAYRAEPAGKPRGAIVVIQEIFGVNSHIKAVADGFAADGYLAIAPAMFDRVQKNFDVGYTPPDIEKGRDAARQDHRRHGDEGRAGGDRRRERRRQGRHRRLLLGRLRRLDGFGQAERPRPPRCPTTAAASSTTPTSSPRCR